MKHEFIGNTPRDLGTLDKWCSQRREMALNPELPIVDAHHHFYDDERGCYLQPQLMEDMRDGHNVVATVYLQHSAAYLNDGPEAMRPVGEVAFAAGIAAQNRSRTQFCAGIVGHANLTLGDEVKPVLEAMRETGGDRFKGIRHGATWDAGSAAYGRRLPPRHLLMAPEFRRGFSQLEPLGLSFDAWIYYPQLPELVDLLQAFPDTKVVLNHCGGVLGIPPHNDREAVFTLWRDAIRQLARYPNLSVKLGGLGMLYGGWEWHHEQTPPDSSMLAEAWRPYVETCIEAFGTDRAMFESNFPVDKQSCGYGVLWNAFKRIAAPYSPREQADLFHGTARRFYRLA